MKASRDHAHSTFAATPLRALPPAVPQPLDCELCGEPDLSPDNFIQGLGAVLCDLCLERLMDTPTEDLL